MLWGNGSGFLKRKCRAPAGRRPWAACQLALEFPCPSRNFGRDALMRHDARGWVGKTRGGAGLAKEAYEGRRVRPAKAEHGSTYG